MNKKILAAASLIIITAVIGGMIFYVKDFSKQVSKNPIVELAAVPISSGENCSQGGVCPNGAVASSSTKPIALETSKDKDCAQDSDCVEFPIQYDKNKCCSSGCGTEAINSIAAARRKAWQTANCSDVDYVKDCPLADCERDFKKAACVANKCELVDPQNIGQCGNDVLCLEKVAEISGSEDACEEVKNLSGCKSRDYFNCLYVLARKNNDRNVCLIMDNIAAGFCSKDEISKLTLDGPKGLKDACFYSTAGSAADCKAIQDVDMKNQCIFEKAAKLSDCSDISAVDSAAKNSRDYKEMCIERVSR